MKAKAVFKVKTVFSLVLIAAMLTGCTTYTDLVRTRYRKIASLSEQNNYEKLADSSFNSYTIYRAHLESDFALQYFWSYRYHYYYSYGFTSYSYDVDIYSSLLFPGESLIQMGNPFADHFSENDSGSTIRLYLLSRQTFLSKRYYLELRIDGSVELSPGVYRARGSGTPVSLVLRDRAGRSLFASTEGHDAFLDIEVVEIRNNILYATYSGKLGSTRGERSAYYDIYNGEIWIKL